MSFEEFVTESYEYLLKLGLIETVIHNAEKYGAYPLAEINSSVIDCLFTWGKTPEGYTYWERIHYNMPKRLKYVSFSETRSHLLNALIDLQSCNTTQPYEYW